MSFKYPEELIEKAKFEMETFSRVGSDTGKELVVEVERLRTELDKYRGQINRFGEHTAADALTPNVKVRGGALLRRPS